MAVSQLRLNQQGRSWVLEGRGASRFRLINDYLGYLNDYNRTSPSWVCSEAFAKTTSNTAPGSIEASRSPGMKGLHARNHSAPRNHLIAQASH